MNKIGLLYDVVKALKEQEKFEGTLQVTVNKDQTKIFGMESEFLKNLQTGAVRSKVKTAFDCDDRQMKHESQTEFNLKDWHGFHGCGHHHGMPHRLQHHGQGRGVKEGLQRLAFGLQLLNQLKVEEQADQSLVLTVSSKDLPAELRQEIAEHVSRHHQFHQRVESAPGRGGDCWSLFHQVTDPEVELCVFIKPNKQVEKLILVVNGTGQDDQGKETSIEGKLELDLVW
jgi:hypothetical protein